MNKDIIIQNDEITVFEYLKKNNLTGSVLAAKVNNKIVQQDFVLKSGDKLNLLDISTDEGYLIYKETLILVLIDAAQSLFGADPLIIRQSVNKSTYFELSTFVNDKESAAFMLKNKMREIIDEEKALVQFKADKLSAAHLFRESANEERARDIEKLPADEIKLCKVGNNYHITYQQVAYSVKCVNNFDITPYEKGYLLRYPTNYTADTIPPVSSSRKIHRAITDYRDWITTVGVSDIFALNKIIREGSAADIVNLSEGLQEKRISSIADKILNHPDIRIILIAGPSSSGKTTFANRLCLHLRINHLSPIVISLDDYYVSNDKMPLDKHGEPDYERVESIDYKLFNTHLSQLAAGEEVTLPRFDFSLGKPVKGRTLRLGEGQIVIVEGIHALNELLTSKVPKKNKYKIYLSALTSLCLDEYNAFSPTDNRLLRRIVRDAAYRSTTAAQTLSLWKNVRKGELKYIFPFESEADEVFNSSLVYELAVLKEPATRLLRTITEDSVHFSRAERLIELLSYFEPLSPEFIPPTSIIREFIGGSTIIK